MKLICAPIGVAPITQLHTCLIKIVTFKGDHLIFIPFGTAIKGKNSLPLNIWSMRKKKTPLLAGSGLIRASA